MLQSAIYSDQDIVKAILNREKNITYSFLYRDCYPLFKAVFNKYYTDCENCLEFINEIYVYLMTPGKLSKKSPLSSFSYRCTLTLWLKLIAENYCKQLYKKKVDTTNKETVSDRILIDVDSLDVDLSSLYAIDAELILMQIPNVRYRELIQLRYLEEKTNEETTRISDPCGHAVRCGLRKSPGRTRQHRGAQRADRHGHQLHDGRYREV